MATFFFLKEYINCQLIAQKKNKKQPKKPKTDDWSPHHHSAPPTGAGPIEHVAPAAATGAPGAGGPMHVDGDNACQDESGVAVPTTTAPRRARKAPAPRFLPGDWLCVCTHHNFARRTQCESCNAARPAETVDPSAAGEQQQQQQQPAASGDGSAAGHSA
jgi:hypothetical protein